MTEHAVYVCTDPGVPAFGRKGCSIHVQAVLRELVARVARVDLVTARIGGPPPPGLEDVVVHELSRPSGLAPAAAERALVAMDAAAARTTAALLTADADRRSPAIVMQRYSLWSCEVMELARATVARGVLELNAPLIDEQANHRSLVDVHTATARTRRAIRAAHRPYAVSTAVAGWASTLAGVPVGVVANGVDAQRFASARRSAPDGPLTIAFVGTFRPWHGLEELTTAAAAVSATGREVRLLLVGDGPERAAMVERARRSGVTVHAVGAVDNSAVPGLLAGADVAVAPYPAGDHYFSPLKVVEYLAAGLPTVAAAVGDL
ncbi:MAG: glycosyltransferase, partial [Acidimicrobiia bacterium]|nr:glycosyltransferase [Acidimicrobiia bacterium]